MVDEAALEHSRETRHQLNNHIQVTAIKLEGLERVGAAQHQQLTEKLDQQQAALKWAAGLIISIMISVMAWALLQQYNANESQKRDLQQQIILLQQQEQARVTGRNEILKGQADLKPAPAN